MNKRLTIVRLVFAVISMALEQTAIWAVWRFLLPQYGINLDIWLLILVMIVWLIAGVGIYIFGTNALNKQVTAGLTTLIGFKGETAGRLDPEGTVKVNGEIWSAVSESGRIEKGESVIVTGEDGLKLKVRKR